MQIIETAQIEDLGFTMLQKNPTHTITAGEHASRFFVFDTCNVWTADGWLITAVQGDGRTHHLRRGRDRCTATLEADEVLHYTPTAKTMHYLQN